MSDAEARWRASLGPQAQRLICQSECGLGFTSDEFAAAIDDLLRDTIAANGTAEDLALYDAIVAESVALTRHLLAAKRPSFDPTSKPVGYDANGSPVEE